MGRRRRPVPGQVRRRRAVAAALLAAAALALAWTVLGATLLAPADKHGAEVRHLTVHSKTVGDRGLTVVVPAEAADHPPLLVFLHGRGGSSGTFDEDEAMFAGLARLGRRAPVVAFPDGGDHGYWHDRDEGDWERYVVDEVIPLAAQETGADPHRVAIGGISMGGFGAYDLALRNPGRFCAVGGHSPALWLAAEDTAPGAFDDAEDFKANDVLGRVREDPGAFGPIPIWNDAGSEDPFLISDVALEEALDGSGADFTHHVWPGAHDTVYWDRHWPAYLRFYAEALAAC